jgi:hypothetical protein
MLKGELVTMLSEQAKQYVKGAQESLQRNVHMNTLRPTQHPVEQEIIDAIVVDFTNYLAARQGIDLALYTRDVRT